MKMIIAVALALVAVAAAAPVDEPIEVLESKFDTSPDGGYHLYYKRSDGIELEEIGELREVPNEKGDLVKVVTVRGHYTQLDENDQAQITNYSADENGYNAEGVLIPKEAVPDNL